MSRLGIDLFDQGARDRIDSQFWDLAKRLLALGQSVILESGFWLRSERDEKRLGARTLGALVELHVLDVSFEDRWRRVERRNAELVLGSVPITREQLGAWDQYFEVPDDAEVDLFD